MVVVRVSDQRRTHGLDVVLDVSAGDLTNGDDPVFIPFSAVDPEKAIVIVHILKEKVIKFFPSYATGVKEFEDGSVSVTQGGLCIRGMEELLHLPLREDRSWESLGS